MRSVLIVCDSINEAHGSGAKANMAMIKSLKDCGYELEVWHYSGKDISFEGVTTIKIPTYKFDFNYVLSRMTRVINRKLKINLNPFFEKWRGFSFTFFNDVKSIVHALNNRSGVEPDLILTLSQAASFRPHAALLSFTKWHDKWMAYVHDPYPFYRYPEPYNWQENGHLIKEDFFKKITEQARYMAFPSRMLMEWMSQFYPAIRDKFKIIPHQVFLQQKTDSKTPGYLSPSLFNIVHAGNIMKERPVTGLLNGFQKFLEMEPGAKENARLLLIGPANEHTSEIQQFMKSVDQVYCTFKTVSYEEALLSQQLASVNVIVESEAAFSPFLPGKFPHCVAADKPILIIGPLQSEVRRLLGKDYTLCAMNNDEEAIAQRLMSIYQLWKTNKNALRLNRPDLMDYLGKPYLKQVFDSIQNHK